MRPPPLHLPRRALLRRALLGPPAALLAPVAALVAGGPAAATPGSASSAAQVGAATGNDSAVSPTRRLVFPRDHGSHPGARTEWWYVTGWLTPPEAVRAAGRGDADPAFGFQITFFRSRTDIAATHPSRFAARQLIFAHAALTDLRDRARGRLRHDQRIARAGFGIAEAAVDDTRVRLRDWSLERRDPDAATADPSPGGVYRMRAASDGARLGFDLELRTTQPRLLQGDQGFSRKGPLPEQASHYYSQPQLAVGGRVQVDGSALEVAGTAWLDHEWSETLLAPEAVGWDWIGINLFDGRALTAFRLRRADGSTLWSGGSLREGDRTTARDFADGEVRFVPGRRWRSPSSQADYPVAWQVETPAGRFDVRALLDAQELDSRGSTGAIYWEGLSEVSDVHGRRVGLGYLEMTGYSGRLQL